MQHGGDAQFFGSPCYEERDKRDEKKEPCNKER